MRYYVDGGEYETHGGEFCLVKPGGSDTRPYVYASRTQSRLTLHHSHHYELSEDMKTVKLIKESGEASAGTPTEATLNEEDFQGVKERITTGDIY